MDTRNLQIILVQHVQVPVQNAVLLQITVLVALLTPQRNFGIMLQTCAITAHPIVWPALLLAHRAPLAFTLMQQVYSAMLAQQVVYAILQQITLLDALVDIH